MSEFLRCRDCKHDKGKCVGSSRRGCHKNCFEPREMTNADRIRAMSDEELAAFLDDLTCLCVDCNDHDGVNENCPIYKQDCGRYCEPKDLMDWLQQPAEES